MSGELQGKVIFEPVHRPILPGGEYDVTIEADFDTGQGKLDVRKLKTTKTFTVVSSRFGLSPDDVVGFYPPDGGNGDYSKVLPHVLLRRSTLPWELSADDTKTPGIPWLAILLFGADEAPEIETVPLSEPGLTATPKPGASGVTTAIRVPAETLKSQLPRPGELELLAHLRQKIEGDDPADDDDDEFAVILANRLPPDLGVTTAHLVSIAGRFKGQAFQSWPDSSGGELLVTLANWSFNSAPGRGDFAQLVTSLDRDPQMLRLPAKPEIPALADHLAEGQVYLPHHLRSGGDTVSWYNGPLVPAPRDRTVPLPVRSADELLSFDDQTEMFDVSLAAAWELGRLLLLQDREMSVKLFHWKRTHAQQTNASEPSQEIPSHLQFRQADSESEEDVAAERQLIEDWFRNLSLLKGLPFSYLVPDEDSLPPESLRFFQVDPLWLDCLIDGAFSVGRLSQRDADLDASHEDCPAKNPFPIMTGFLLRSQVVSAWPGLLVDGFSKVVGKKQESKPGKNSAVETLRLEKLAPNTLLCLFAGNVQLVDLHLRPEDMHFGFDGVSSGNVTKTLDGSDVSVEYRDSNARLLDVIKLAKAVAGPGRPTSAGFAVKMIEGTRRMRFFGKAP